MTGALVIYSAVFMRYALAVTPKNYLLFACHFINEGSQLVQGYRFIDYHYWGGKDNPNVKAAIETAQTKAKAAAKDATAKAEKAVSK
jgi:mitochondrial pyruvate carrier 1